MPVSIIVDISRDGAAVDVTPTQPDGADPCDEGGGVWEIV